MDADKLLIDAESLIGNRLLAAPDSTIFSRSSSRLSTSKILEQGRKAIEVDYRV